MPQDGTVEVTIGSYTYVLREELGWYDIARIQEQRTTMLVPSGTARITRESVVEVRQNRAATDLLRLQARLASWSRKEALTEANIRRLPPSHARVLLDKIDELEGAEDSKGLSEAEKNSPTA